MRADGRTRARGRAEARTAREDDVVSAITPGPVASRPHMPGYGLLGPDQGTGLLPWSWAEERLGASHDYWVATVRPDGRPHLMPVWAVWHDSSLWFSSSKASRKAANLAVRPRCTIATDNALEPVVIEGDAHVVSDPPTLRLVLDLENTKYHTDYSIETLDPAVNVCLRVRPRWAFGLSEDDFTGSPTRWVFEAAG
jgi:general stress protein 26